MTKLKYYYRFGFVFCIYFILSKFKMFNAWATYKYTEIRKTYFENMDKEHLKKEIEDYYYVRTKIKIDLNNPITLNEKIQWLKLYDCNDRKIILSDKYLANQYIKDIVGENHVAKQLALGDTLKDIDFETLPNSFVIKSTQGSGNNIIVRDKSKCDFEKLNEKTKFWGKLDFAYMFFEFQYKLDNTKVLVEEYLGDDILEYKFMCFNGKSEFFWVRGTQNGKLTRNFYDMNCQKLEFGFGNAPKYENLKLIDSDTFAELCGYVEELARGFKFVRVDTFVTDNTYYIGELTFTTGAGYDSWKPYEYEKKYGDLISVR